MYDTLGGGGCSVKFHMNLFTFFAHNFFAFVIIYQDKNLAL